MPRRAAHGRTGGRATPKGRATAKGTQPGTGRYTPPIPREVKVSPKWVPVLMFTLLISGLLVIVLNYLGVMPTASGDASNWYLLLGLGLITGGFITATGYR
jgi:hypothetical protein